MQRSVSGKIEITKIPDGGAPRWVREGWVGSILPVVAISDDASSGVLSGKNVPRQFRYLVPQRPALAELALRSIEARRYWAEQGFPDDKDDGCFGFRIDQAKVLGVLEDGEPEKILLFTGLLKAGLGAHDYWLNREY